ncbi:MAG: FAD/FMN-containing dehydrogenase [Myxococcota bacterium]|jgi:FAD/FMN-containing dehydrogenase
MLTILRKSGGIIRPTAAYQITTFQQIRNIHNDKRFIFSKMKEFVGEKGVLIDSCSRKEYSTGHRYGEGNAMAVVFPENRDQLAHILKFCEHHRIEVVPQGGKSGLVGGSIADHNAICLSLIKFEKDNIIIDEKNESVTVSASFTVDSINEKLKIFDLICPLNFGATGSANIGGMLATNPAGIEAIGYGDLREMTISCKMMIPSGEILEFITKPTKGLITQDNSTIKDSPIGSWGTLGVFLSAKIKLSKIPKEKEQILFVPNSKDDMQEIKKNIFDGFNGEEYKVSSFEIIPVSVLRILSDQNINIRDPFKDEIRVKDDDYSFLIQIDSTSEDGNLSDKVNDVFSDLEYKGKFKSCIVQRNFTKERHLISHSIAKIGDVLGFDVSTRDISLLQNFIEEAEMLVKKKWPDFISTPYGHYGRGAVHLNFVLPKELGKIDSETKKSIQKEIYGLVVNKYKGSISAEHGIGSHNLDSYHDFTSDSDKNKALAMKKEYDPCNIMNRIINLSSRPKDKPKDFTEKGTGGRW